MNGRIIRACAALLLACGVMLMSLAPKAESAINEPMIGSSEAIEPGFELNAAAMAMIECESREVLACVNGDEPLPMASTTKIMTALVVLENSNAEELVSVPDEAVGTEGSSVYLQRGEKMKVIDLLYGLMLASGNDAAVALAVHAGGSVKGFVDMMNEKAKELGLKNTRFVTPNGLHAEGHYTTAFELCVITREALRSETFKEIVSSKYHRTESGNVPRTFKNKNSLLWDYEGAFGVKTGYTMAAGRCLVFGAERDGMQVVGALLNCRPMFEKAAMLLDTAFESFVKQTVIGSGQTAGRVNVENGVENVLEVETKRSIIAVTQRSHQRTFMTRAELPQKLSAPVKAGQRVGTLFVYEGERLVGSAELVASKTIQRRDARFWWRLLSSVFAA